MLCIPKMYLINLIIFQAKKFLFFIKVSNFKERLFLISNKLTREISFKILVDKMLFQDSLSALANKKTNKIHIYK